jgi:hypothetical protein
MNSSAVACGQQIAQGFLWQGLVPILVALVAYVCTYKIGDWRDRKKYSKLGIAVIESLLEELNTGISIMERIEGAVNDPFATAPPLNIGELLPSRTWSGPQTISDEVLLRIIETSRGRTEHGLPVTACRIHCKNYFDHMCGNYNHAVEAAVAAIAAGNNWKLPFVPMLARPNGIYLEGARGVRDMLNRAREQLEANAKRWIPR